MRTSWDRLNLPRVKRHTKDTFVRYLDYVSAEHLLILAGMKQHSACDLVVPATTTPGMQNRPAHHSYLHVCFQLNIFRPERCSHPVESALVPTAA
jgi:hypothetical protein